MARRGKSPQEPEEVPARLTPAILRAMAIKDASTPLSSKKQGNRFFYLEDTQRDEPADSGTTEQSNSDYQEINPLQLMSLKKVQEIIRDRINELRNRIEQRHGPVDDTILILSIPGLFSDDVGAAAYYNLLGEYVNNQKPVPSSLYSVTKPRREDLKLVRRILEEFKGMHRLRAVANYTRQTSPSSSIMAKVTVSKAAPSEKRVAYSSKFVKAVVLFEDDESSNVKIGKTPDLRLKSSTLASDGGYVADMTILNSLLSELNNLRLNGSFRVKQDLKTVDGLQEDYRKYTNRIELMLLMRLDELRNLIRVAASGLSEINETQKGTTPMVNVSTDSLMINVRKDIRDLISATEAVSRPKRTRRSE